MDPRDFAAGVVDNALKKKSNAYYWRGGNATIVWLVSTFLPHTFPVKINPHLRCVMEDLPG